MECHFRLEPFRMDKILFAKEDRQKNIIIITAIVITGKKLKQWLLLDWRVHLRIF